jgi:hypothetical protein
VNAMPTDDTNTPGTRLTCSNQDCGCELEVVRPCPHGSTYRCACGHDMHAHTSG